MIVQTKTSHEEYLANEAKAEAKSEYVAGEVVMMAGGKIQHDQIILNLLSELIPCLKKKGCRILSSDVLTYFSSCDRYFYPDLKIVCGKPELKRHNGIDVLLNPEVIIEVLSDSTEIRDKVDKLECYQRIDSVRQYVMVDSRSHWVSTYDRLPEGWLLKHFDQLAQQINIAGCLVSLADIYDQVEWEADTNES